MPHRVAEPSAAVSRERIVESDRRFVWHPYTPMQEYLAGGDPLVIVRAEGTRLIDANGREYIDGNASWWTSLLGHGHPRLVRALCRQASTLCHAAFAGITHEPGALLAEELVAVAPAGLTRVFYSDDGSTAVEVALKLALQFWSQNGRPERRRFVALDDAFHGETLGATAIGGVEVFRRPFAGALLDCVHVPPGEAGHERAFAVLEQLIAGQSDSIAALVIEPIVQGAGGMRMYAPEYLTRAREITRQHDVLLVADEVFTGYGRTGPMWASEHSAVTPDVLCTAKGFCGGMLPMAATLVTERLFEGFYGDPSRAFYYGHTFCGNPLGAAVAREVLAVYRDEDVLANAVPKAERIRSAFAALGELPGVAQSRSLGMIGALDLAGARGYLERGGWDVYHEALARGAYVRPLGNTVYIAPALNIVDSDLDSLLEIVGQSVRAVTLR